MIPPPPPSFPSPYAARPLRPKLSLHEPLLEVVAKGWRKEAPGGISVHAELGVKKVGLFYEPFEPGAVWFHCSWVFAMA